MSPSLRNLRDQVGDHLSRMEIDADPGADGVYALRCGSSLVFISCFEHEGRPYVRLVALLLLGFRPKMELLSRLLRLNSRVLFGSFQLFDDETLCFTHTLPAHLSGEDRSGDRPGDRSGDRSDRPGDRPDRADRRVASLDFDTFAHALRYVSRVADDHDERLQSLAGGERGEELLE